MNDTDIFSPKGGFVFSMLNDTVEIFGNVGRGFAIMAGFAEQAQFTQDNWYPQLRDQIEVGTRATLFNRARLQLIYFRLDTDDDFLQDPETLDYINADETSRKGRKHMSHTQLKDDIRKRWEGRATTDCYHGEKKPHKPDGRPFPPPAHAPTETPGSGNKTLRGCGIEDPGKPGEASQELLLPQFS